jgi:hypothetical protein
MRQSLARYSAPASLGHAPSSVGFITTIAGLNVFGTHKDKIAQEIARHQAADRSYLEEGAKLIELAHGAQRLFAKQEAQEQRRLLNFVLSNSIWKEGELTATFRQPFNLIEEATAAASGEEGGGGRNSPGHPAWLGNLDSNQDKQSQSLLCYRYTIPQ